MTRFQGKVALVTGAGSGIGLATAIRIADEGGTVIAGILDESQRPAVERFDSVVLDVRSEENWDAALDHFGPGPRWSRRAGQQRRDLPDGDRRGDVLGIMGRGDGGQPQGHVHRLQEGDPFDAQP